MSQRVVMSDQKMCREARRVRAEVRQENYEQRRDDLPGRVTGTSLC